MPSCRPYFSLSAAGSARRALLSAAAAVLLAGCAAPAPAPWPDDARGSHLLAVDERGVDACRDALRTAKASAGNALDAQAIDVFNWNMRKTSLPNWREDYDRLTRGMDLILLQEASLRPDTVGDLPAVPYWSFAPGYRTRDAITGVLTLSRVEPLTRCTFVTAEPVLRSPKATSITQFGLTGREETLLVVNLHSVNFSFGLASYKRQFEQVAGVLRGHSGPVILSGDFNTWREGRLQTVESLARAFRLEPLDFAEGRSLFFGRPVDHIYVRNLKPRDVRTTSVDSSDHNPLSVTLSL